MEQSSGLAFDLSTFDGNTRMQCRLHDLPAARTEFNSRWPSILSNANCRGGLRVSPIASDGAGTNRLAPP